MDPLNGDVYLTLTNRTRLASRHVTDEANPRHSTSASCVAQSAQMPHHPWHELHGTLAFNWDFPVWCEADAIQQLKFRLDCDNDFSSRWLWFSEAQDLLDKDRRCAYTCDQA